MKRVSEKTATREAECCEFRRQLVWEVGRCEICNHEPGRAKLGQIDWRLCCHEIANGPHRQKALDKPYAILVVCWWCNSERLTDKRLWPIARQLAALKRSRLQDYNLTRFNELVGRGPWWMEEEDVARFADTLVSPATSLST